MIRGKRKGRRRGYHKESNSEGKRVNERWTKKEKKRMAAIFVDGKAAFD